MAAHRDPLFLEGLKTLLGDRDHFELRRPNAIHQRALGITQTPSLNRVIELSAIQDLDAQDEEGVTALGWAALRGDGATMQTLLEAGANPDLRDASGETSLGLAACSMNPEGIRLLLFHGATVIPNKRLVSPVNRAVIRQDDESYLKPFVEFGLHHKWFHEPDDIGDTPLLLAVWLGRPRIMSFLFEHGVSIDEGPLPPVAVAIQYGPHSTTKMLLERDADPTTHGAEDQVTVFEADDTDTTHLLKTDSTGCEQFGVLGSYSRDAMTKENPAAMEKIDLNASQILRRRGREKCSIGFIKAFECLLEDTW